APWIRQTRRWYWRRPWRRASRYVAGYRGPTGSAVPGSPVRAVDEKRRAFPLWSCSFPGFLLLKRGIIKLENRANWPESDLFLYRSYSSASAVESPSHMIICNGRPTRAKSENL